MMKSDYKKLLRMIKRCKVSGQSSPADYNLYDNIERTLNYHTCDDDGMRHDRLKNLFAWINDDYRHIEHSIIDSDIKILQVLTYCVMRAKHSFIVPHLGRFQGTEYYSTVIPQLCERVIDTLIDSVNADTRQHSADLSKLQRWIRQNSSSISSAIGESAFKDWDDSVLYMKRKYRKVAISSLQRMCNTGKMSDLHWGLYLKTRSALEDVNLAYKEGGIESVSELIRVLEECRRYRCLNIVVNNTKQFDDAHPCISSIRESMLQKLAEKCMFYDIYWTEQQSADDAINSICKKLKTDSLYFTSIVTGPNGEDWLSESLVGNVVLNSASSFRESGKSGDDSGEGVQRFTSTRDDGEDKMLDCAPFIRSMSMTEAGARSRSYQMNEVRAMIKVNIPEFLSSFFARLRNMMNESNKTDRLYWSEYENGEWKKRYLNGKNNLHFSVTFGHVEYVDSERLKAPDVLVKDGDFKEEEEVRLALIVSMPLEKSQTPNLVKVDNDVLKINIGNSQKCFECIGYSSAEKSFKTLDEALTYEKSQKANKKWE